MRTAISVLLVLAACGDPELPKLVDATVDETVDATPDAPPPDAGSDPAVAAVCATTCDRIAMCFGLEPGDRECNLGCVEDLVDCTEQELADIDACTTQDCGDPEDPKTSPLLQCIVAVPCVD